jgi:hypothetical protein
MSKSIMNSIRLLFLFANLSPSSFCSDKVLFLDGEIYTTKLFIEVCFPQNIAVSKADPTLTLFGNMF